jgi:hypothetical protein
MRRAAKINIACSVGWLLLTLAYFAFYHDKLLSIFTPLLGGALLLACIPLAVTTAIAGIKGKPRLLLAVAVLVVAVAIVGWLTPVGATFGARCKLWREKPYYQSVVAKVAAGADDSAFDYPITVDPGPPPRVAFSWGGILDNWHGVVYDPTGGVMEANILDRTTWSNRWDYSRGRNTTPLASSFGTQHSAISSRSSMHWPMLIPCWCAKITPGKTRPSLCH